MPRNTNKNKKTRLKFICDFNKEFWFISNKYDEAAKLIGKKRFGYIVNQNIPNCYSENRDIFHKKLVEYLNSRKKIVIQLSKKRIVVIEKKWKKIETKFFQQMGLKTGINWKHKTYKAYMTYSCFWGGDYDVAKKCIYINPLLEHGDPLYVIFHEMSHLIYWEYIQSNYDKKFITRNNNFLWQLSEVMVNYPLLKIKLGISIPLVIPKKIERLSKSILRKFSSLSYLDIVDQEIKKKAR